MRDRQSLPDLWLLSDARNDLVLEEALAILPAGSGFVFRHYHLRDAERRARFVQLAGVAREHRHCIILAGEAGLACAWAADGVYGPIRRVRDAEGLLRLATVHDAAEIAATNAANVDGVFLSPVFATRSHGNAEPLGADRFHHLAALSRVPVIALGGMDQARAQELGWPRWGAIDGLSPTLKG